MLARNTRVTLAGLAMVASLAACSSQAKQQSQYITPQNAAKAQAVGAQLAAQEAEETAQHKAEISRLIRAELSNAKESDRTLRLALGVINYTNKTIKSLEIGLEVDDANGNALGRTELRSAQTIGPKAQTSIVFNRPYTAFGSGTAAVRESLGKSKRYLFDVKEIKYTDGSDAGYDD